MNSAAMTKFQASSRLDKLIKREILTSWPDDQEKVRVREQGRAPAQAIVPLSRVDGAEGKEPATARATATANGRV